MRPFPQAGLLQSTRIIPFLEVHQQVPRDFHPVHKRSRLLHPQGVLFALPTTVLAGSVQQTSVQTQRCLRL